MYNWYEIFNNSNNQESFLVDVVEKEYLYEVYANLAGYAKEDIKVTFNNGYLNIFAHHNNKNNDGRYLLHERNYKDKSRSIYFGDIKEEKISAKMENGVLVVQIYLKKPEVKQAKVISID